MKPLIDVVIPTKNCADDLRRCLESLKRQTVPVHVIVVDANSTDDTVRVAREYGCTVLFEPKDLPDPVNNRCAFARNLGLRYCRSMAVAFLDADVEVPSGWAEELYNALMTGCAVAVTSGCTPPDPDEDEFAFLVNRVLQFGSSHAWRFEEHTLVESVPTYNAMYLRDVLDEVGGFDESLEGAEDWELNYRLRQKGYLLMGVPFSPVKHRHHITLREFIREMFGYGWSRGHLLIKKHILTVKNMLPSLAIFGFIFSLLFLPWWITIRLIFLYLWVNFMLSFRSLGLLSTPKRLAIMQLLFILFHGSYGVGYLKGILDTIFLRKQININKDSRK